MSTSSADKDEDKKKQQVVTDEEQNEVKRRQEREEAKKKAMDAAIKAHLEAKSDLALRASDKPEGDVMKLCDFFESEDLASAKSEKKEIKKKPLKREGVEDVEETAGVEN